MPTFNKRPTGLAAAAQAAVTAPRRHGNDHPLWAGPCGEGPLGGVTQSMLGKFFGCRERFRLKYVVGLEPHERWNHRLGYGNMWHACEEALAAHVQWDSALSRHTEQMLTQFPLQRDEISKWCSVCAVQFPEYVRYWQDHPDVVSREPLLQEYVFDVPYKLPSGRVVRLRGKYDSVDLIDGDVWLQENKTKGDVDKVQIERQLRFDLQTMMYLVALSYQPSIDLGSEAPIRGVRYNVVRREVTIRPHAARTTKYTSKPAESQAEFYERLRRDYYAAKPDYYFFRVTAEVGERDLRKFQDTCLDPLLEQLCCWYDIVTGKRWLGDTRCVPPMNYRTPFGIYNPLQDDGATEYDACLETGSEAGLRRVDTLFQELQ